MLQSRVVHTKGQANNSNLNGSQLEQQQRQSSSNTGLYLNNSSATNNNQVHNSKGVRDNSGNLASFLSNPKNHESHRNDKYNASHPLDHHIAVLEVFEQKRR